MDIVIVLDGSNSIYPWEPMNKFLLKLIPSLDIGPRSTQVERARLSCSTGTEQEMKSWPGLVWFHFQPCLCFQVSVIQYGVDPHFMFVLNQYKTKEEVVDAASKITQIYGDRTNTFRAIQFAR